MDANNRRLLSAGEASGRPDGGVRVARLAVIKNDIANNLRQHALSIHGIASRHGISVGYIRQAFAAEGTTFTKFVLQQRLASAYLMLGNTRFADRTISAIAFEVGIGDVSSFNRAFRRRYGVTPSDMREQAHLKGGE